MAGDSVVRFALRFTESLRFRRACLVSPSVFGFAERDWFRRACLVSPSVFGFAERVWFLRTRFVSPSALRSVISVFFSMLISSDLYVSR